MIPMKSMSAGLVSPLLAARCGDGLSRPSLRSASDVPGGEAA